MTAVASASSIQSPPHWETSSDGGETAPIFVEDMSNYLLPDKNVLRTNSVSSSSSTPSISSSFSAGSTTPSSHANGDNSSVDGEASYWKQRAKTGQRFWHSTKSEATLTTGRSQPPMAAPSLQSAMPSMAHPSQQVSSAPPKQTQQLGNRSDYQQLQRNDSTALLVLQPLTGTFDKKRIAVPYFPDVQKIGRQQLSQKTIPAANNGYFDSKVLSRQHAEIWADRNGKIWIRDVKSSNGTFVNGVRLSAENKESDPHEIRENDTLELGIDIISEDQKSVVHHKVAAKVEMAGIYNNPPILDMMHMENGASQPLSGDMSNSQFGQARNKVVAPGAAGRANIAMAGHNIGASRQMNMWMGPITIEQVVKNLTSEIKSAKQQSEELNRTGNYFNALLNLEPGEKFPQSPHKKVPPQDGPEASASAMADNLTSLPQMPPPTQPLPEKPILSSPIANEYLGQPGSLKRTDTERPRSSDTSAHQDPQNSQILSLLEALKSAKKEIDSQADRMQYLESALLRERQARIVAEKRTRTTPDPEAQHMISPYDQVADDGPDPPLDTLELLEQDQPNGYAPEDEGSTSLKRSRASTDTLRETDNSTTQARFDMLIAEINELKQTAERYKCRAEEAEKAQQQFATLVESLRSTRDTSMIPDVLTDPGSRQSSVGTVDLHMIANTASNQGGFAHSGLDHWDNLAAKEKSRDDNPDARSRLQRDLDRTINGFLKQHRNMPDATTARMAHSAPYVSMLGVVLIGVGMMTWLNGWPSSTGAD